MTPIDLLVSNLVSPPLLFFAIGVAATLLRSDLDIPEPLAKLFSLYLLWAIGFKGGVALAEAGWSIEALKPVVAAVLLSAATPFVMYPILKRTLRRPDACAAAACFGSVSVVTFLAAANFLTSEGVDYGGHMVASLALMESPAIVAGIWLYRRWERVHGGDASASGHGLRDAFTAGPVFLLLGSLLVGVLTGPEQFEPYRAFTEDIFYGVLALFLLEAGMKAGAGLPQLRAAGPTVAAVGIFGALLNGAIGFEAALALGLDVGDTLLLTILAASASYIAAPAAMRLAAPEADAGVYLPIALGVVFPFNIVVGIPMWLAAARAAAG